MPGGGATFYDPSYGVTYTSLCATGDPTSMEATAVGGYVDAVWAGATLIGYKFRTNDGLGHLVAAPSASTPYGGTY